MWVHFVYSTEEYLENCRLLKEKNDLIQSFLQYNVTLPTAERLSLGNQESHNSPQRVVILQEYEPQKVLCGIDLACGSNRLVNYRPKVA